MIKEHEHLYVKLDDQIKKLFENNYICCKISKDEISDDFFNERGIGEIKNSKVFYKGTYWKIDSKIKIDSFEEGEKVVVLKTFKNSATIQKR